MKKLITLTFSLIATISMLAQPILKPTIGVGTLPQDSDPICTIPMVGGASDNIFVNDTIPHFNLYDINGVNMDIGTTLSQGKAVLIMCGSFTCPAFRNKVDELDNLKSMYPTQLEVMMIYVVEAHPKSPDLCPYSGLVNEANNVGTSAHFYQPTTYLERKNAVQAFIDSMSTTINGIPIYIDGPCNEWWHAFGEAPNDGFLIGPDGIVGIEQVWFDKFPEDMFADVAAYIAANPTLGTPEYFNSSVKVYPNPVGAEQNIHFDIPKDFTHYKIVIMDVAGKIISRSSNQSVISIQNKNIPAGVYYWKFTTDNTSKTGKIIIN